MKAPLMRLCLLLVTSGAIVPPATAQVVQPRPTVRAAITVTSPKTGDRLSVGRTTPIRWSSTGVLSRAVDIALVESQREVGVIARGVPNSGIYDWAVPRMQRAGTYVIAIRTSDGAVTGLSGQFTIVGLTIARTQPTIPQPAGDYPVPNVTSFSPSDRGYIGLTITFLGRDFVPDHFAARVGTQVLAITSRATNKIEATLPSQATTGDLVVSHGTAASEYVLKAGYRVAGDAAIMDAQPRTFARGATVTVTGTDLDQAYPLNWGADNSASGYIKLSTASESYGSPGFIKVYGWSVSPDGKTATFQVFDAYTAGVTSAAMTMTSPQPTAVTGPLRLAKIGTNQLPVVGPSLTWTGAMTLTKLSPPSWGQQAADFIIVQPDATMNGVSFEGTGLWGATASIGNTPLWTSVSYSGLNGAFRVPYTALTDYVVFTKGTQTARSPQPLKVVPAPRLADAATTPWGLALNSEHEIAGWDLTPGSSVSGLAYELRLGYAQEFTPCHLQYVLVSQTTNAIKFRVDTTAAVPAVCLTTGLFQEHATAYHVMQLIAKYGGVEKELWRRPFFLIAQ